MWRKREIKFIKEKRGMINMQNKIIALALIVLICTVSALFYTINADYLTKTFTISSGSFPTSLTYHVEIEGTNTYVLKDKYGDLIYRGSNASYAINYAITHTTVHPMWGSRMGGKVCIHEGLYNITSTIYLKGYVNLEGVGDCVLIQAANVTVIEINGANEVYEPDKTSWQPQIRRLKVWGNENSYSKPAIYINRTSWMTLEDIWIDQMGGTAIYVDERVWDCKFDRVVITRSGSLSEPALYIKGTATYPVNWLHIYDMHIEESPGWAVQTGTQVHNIIWRNAKFHGLPPVYNTTSNGVEFNGYRSSFEGCTFAGFAEVGLYITNWDNRIIANQFSDLKAGCKNIHAYNAIDLIIQGCTMQGNGTSDYGIYLYNCHNVSIANCFIWNYATPIYHSGCTNLNIFENPISEYSFIVYMENNVIYAKDGMTGQIRFRDSDASTVIQAAINALYGTNKEGDIFIKRATYNITSDITIGKRTRLIAEMGTLFNVTNNLSNGCIVISNLNNEARWQIIGLKIDLNYYNGNGIYSSHAGQDGHEGHARIQDVKIRQVKAGYCGIALRDPFYMIFDNIEIRSNNGIGIKLTIDDTRGINYGNLIMNEVLCSVSAANAVGFHFEGGATNLLNLLQLNRIQAIGGSQTGTIGLYAKRVNWVDAIALNIENVETGVKLEECFLWNIQGGFISSGIVYGLYLAGTGNGRITLDGLQLRGSTYDIIDEKQSTYRSTVNQARRLHLSDVSPPRINVRTNFEFYDCNPINPFGVFSTPFSVTTYTIDGSSRYVISPYLGTTSSFVSGREYCIVNHPILLSVTGGSGVNITLKDRAGTTLASGLNSFIGYLPLYTRITITYSSAPTVTISGL